MKRGTHETQCCIVFEILSHIPLLFAQVHFTIANCSVISHPSDDTPLNLFILSINIHLIPFRMHRLTRLMNTWISPSLHWVDGRVQTMLSTTYNRTNMYRRLSLRCTHHPETHIYLAHVTRGSRMRIQQCSASTQMTGGECCSTKRYSPTQATDICMNALTEQRFRNRMDAGAAFQKTTGIGFTDGRVRPYAALAGRRPVLIERLNGLICESMHVVYTTLVWLKNYRPTDCWIDCIVLCKCLGIQYIRWFRMETMTWTSMAWFVWQQPCRQPVVNELLRRHIERAIARMHWKTGWFQMEQTTFLACAQKKNGLQKRGSA